VEVLANVLFLIKGVKRAYQQQDGGEISRQHGSNRGAAPLETKQKWSARSHFLHLCSRGAHGNFGPQFRSRRMMVYFTHE
jgi:hypothetical protein